MLGRRKKPEIRIQVKKMQSDNCGHVSCTLVGEEPEDKHHISASAKGPFTQLAAFFGAAVPMSIDSDEEAQKADEENASNVFVKELTPSEFERMSAEAKKMQKTPDIFSYGLYRSVSPLALAMNSFLNGMGEKTSRISGKSFEPITPPVENCAGMVDRVLQAGGIDELRDVISPDGAHEALKKSPLFR